MDLLGRRHPQRRLRHERRGQFRQFRLKYTTTLPSGQKVESDYPIELTATTPHYGGLRRWFLCPGTTCGRRVRKLYLPPGCVRFACRHCHGLAYSRSRASRRLRGSFDARMRRYDEEIARLRKHLERLDAKQRRTPPEEG